MKKTFFLFIILLVISKTNAQNCSQISYGNPAYIPINDLGTGTWNGFMGGLYPKGSNYIPQAHLSAGLQLANQIQPLDANGNPDPINGKIGFISIGMSNGTMEFSVFIPMSNADKTINPKVTLVDCAEGGMSTDIISIVHARSYKHYWDSTVVQRLSKASMTAKQVQVIWYKEAYPVGSPGQAPQVYSDSLRQQSKRIMNIIKLKFPNAKICYLASRIYAGYATSDLNPEPYSYWQGWTMKWMIEDQINKDPSLQYSGIGANAPWLCWGTYNWANGTTPRSDGLTWICPTDFNSDGTHPNANGRQKVATMLLNFLDSDSTACWYRGGGCTPILGQRSVQLPTKNCTIFPNPSNDKVYVDCYKNQNLIVRVYTMMGVCVLQRAWRNRTNELDMSSFSNGIYSIKVSGTDWTEQQKFLKE